MHTQLHLCKLDHPPHTYHSLLCLIGQVFIFHAFRPIFSLHLALAIYYYRMGYNVALEQLYTIDCESYFEVHNDQEAG